MLAAVDRLAFYPERSPDHGRGLTRAVSPLEVALDVGPGDGIFGTEVVVGVGCAHQDHPRHGQEGEKEREFGHEAGDLLVVDGV